jgi:excisionase family DNA binding protein
VHDRGTEGVSVGEAARELGVSRATIQNWIRDGGAPTVVLGSVGRGCGSRVDPEQLRRWRLDRALKDAAPASLAGRCDLQVVSRALWKSFTKPYDDTAVPFWKALRLPRGEVAALLLESFREIARAGTGHPIEDEALPPEMLRLLSIFLDCLHRRIRP